jgi:hypothetical protein
MYHAVSLFFVSWLLSMLNSFVVLLVSYIINFVCLRVNEPVH